MNCWLLLQIYLCYLWLVLWSMWKPWFHSLILFSCDTGISYIAPHLNNLYFLTLCQRLGVYQVVRGLFLLKLGLSVVMLLAGADHVYLLCIFVARWEMNLLPFCFQTTGVLLLMWYGILNVIRFCLNGACVLLFTSCVGSRLETELVSLLTDQDKTHLSSLYCYSGLWHCKTVECWIMQNLF